MSNQLVKIWDIKEEKYWEDENEGHELVFKDETAARNMMYSEGYTYEYMSTAVEFHPFTPIDKTSYDLQ
jgi:hypothetical protein